MPIHLAFHRRLLRIKRQQLTLPFGAQRFLALLEGIEGGFAVGASVVVGLSFANLSHRVLLITAIVSILVNGFNSAAVKYSSEHYDDELDGDEERDSFRHYFVPSAIEFVAYFVIGFVTLLPLLLLEDRTLAILSCCSLTLLMLFAAGCWRGYLMQLHPLRDGLEMLLLGVSIILVGALTGYSIHLL